MSTRRIWTVRPGLTIFKSLSIICESPDMIDPLAEVVTLLQPVAGIAKVVSGVGTWRLRSVDIDQPAYCVILEGACHMTVDDRDPMSLQRGDFILIPTAYSFTMSSLVPAGPEETVNAPVALPDGGYRLGMQKGMPDFLLLVGHFEFGSPDAGLLVSLLPRVMHVSGERRLATLVQLVIDESRALRPARDVILSRLLEVLLIEALRSTTGTLAPQGLLRGLADERLAVAIRLMHKNPKSPWTVAQLAKEAALSRSTFFDRFNRVMGMSPMEYLLAWRMALAKNLLRRKEAGITEVAGRVGYGSASAFSVAFTRHVGLPPTLYVREQLKSRGP
jgi:AraC-like DNA-binding protein